MSEPTIWWLIAGVFVALELVTGTFYLLMLAVGMAAAALAAQAGAGIVLQLLVAALVGGGAVVVWYQVKNANRQTLQPVPTAVSTWMWVKLSRSRPGILTAQPT